MNIPDKEYLTFDDVMIAPRLGVVSSRDEIDTSTTIAGWGFKIPVMSAPMQAVTERRMAIEMAKVGGLGVIHRFSTALYQQRWLTSVPRPKAMAIGMKGGIERAKIVDCDILVMDVAHAHSKDGIEFVKAVKKEFPDRMLIAGSVASRSGARDLLEAGADALRVGIGPGHACTTRIQTGCGIPQLSAIIDCSEVAAEYGKQVIADGGIRSSGDIVKALAAGASCVMIGRLLASAIESPLPGRYFGQASAASAVSSRYIEGDVGAVEMNGRVSQIIDSLMAGVRSGISYAGAYDIPSLQEKAHFIRVSAASVIESHPKIGAR